MSSERNIDSRFGVSSLWKFHYNAILSVYKNILLFPNSTEHVVRSFYHPFLTQFKENSLLPLIIHHQLPSNYYSKQIICTFHNIHLLQEQHTMLLLEKEQQTTAISLLLPFSPLIIPYTWITLLCNCWVVNDYRISLWTPRQNVQSHALLLIFPCMLPCIYTQGFYMSKQ